MQSVKVRVVHPETAKSMIPSLELQTGHDPGIIGEKVKVGVSIPFNSQGHIGADLRIATCGSRTHTVLVYYNCTEYS